MTGPGEPAADDRTGSLLADVLRSSSRRAAGIVDEHLADYEEVLPTVLLGDFGRWFWAALGEGAAADARVARSAALALETLFVAGDDAMETVIATGFLEALPHPGEHDREVVEELPPSLRRMLRRMEEWRPGS